MQTIQSITIPLADISPNKGQIPGVPKNPRIIRDNKFRLLKKSIEEDPEMLGLREILVYKYGGKYIIIGGNMRFQALKDLGHNSAIVKIIPQEWSTEKLKAIVIKDNSGFGEWDWDALANQWEAEALQNWGIDVPDFGEVKDTEEAEEDYYNPDKEPEVPAKSKPGDIYVLGRHRLICGDCTDPKLLDFLCGGNLVDLYLTDPPYNVDYSGKNKALNKSGKGNSVQKDIANDQMTDEQFTAFLSNAFSNASAHLKPGGVAYIWHAETKRAFFQSAFEDAGLQWAQTLVWKKNVFVLGRQDYQWIHESCLYGWKPGAAHYFIDMRNQVTITKNDKGEPDFDRLTKAEAIDLLKAIHQLPTTVIDCPKPLKSELHPTMKPVKLMGILIRNSSRPGDIILDTFAGSGSTLIACEQLGRKCYSVELDPHYIDTIINRWQEYTQQEASYLGNINDNK